MYSLVVLHFIHNLGVDLHLVIKCQLLMFNQ